MNIWLYKRCKLYRRCFAEELYKRRIFRLDRRIKARLLKQMEAAQRVFLDEIEVKDYKGALCAAAFYCRAYNEYYN